MKSSKYWEQRALAREDQAARTANKTLQSKVYASYNRASEQITQDVQKIFDRYMVDGKLTSAEARQLLSRRESEKVLNALKSKLDSISDPDVKREALNRLHAQAYAARISRLEAVRENIHTQMAKVADTEIAATKSVLDKTYRDTYYRSIYDTQQGTNLAYDFAQLPQRAIDVIVNENWSGAHFSKRIWGNTQFLADEAFKTVSSGIMSGMSIHRMSKQLSKQLDEVMLKGKYAATRLVRTETNRAYNEAEKAAYKEDEIEKYRYLATLDSRTCSVCGALDGQVFQLEDAVTGLNYPPLHPNDRCTTVAFFDDEALDNLKRRAKDPETGETKVLADYVSYSEWFEANKT